MADAVPFTSPEDRDFFAAIGRLVISWAELESGLEAMIDIVHEHMGGKEIDSERPRALNRKLSYLRKFVRAASKTDEVVNSSPA
jgi:hypothetical protein